MDGPSVDFAIITALKVERAAVVSRLTDDKKIQFPDEPLTFYTGQVAIPGDPQPYTVVVTQLIEMGNTDAAIAATRIIQRWQPRNVLMIGIAGGVRDKVHLGDVVVAQFAFYYEPAKLIAGEQEWRSRQFTSDPMLYARAQHYEAAEWKAEIQVPRPGVDQGEARLPEVHFGPIACGEKVIADLDELGELRRQCPKMLAVAMEGAGVARAVLSDGSPPRYLEIRGISDYAGPDKNDGWHEYAADAAAAFAIGFLRSRPFPPGPPPERAPSTDKAPATVVLSAQSLRKIGADELTPAHDEGTKRGEIQFLPLDFTDLVHNKAFSDPEAAARRLTDAQGPLLGALARAADARMVFHGLAAIPPVVLAGHLVTDRRLIRLFDYHPETASWAWPGTGEAYPELQLAGIPKRPMKEPGDVIIRVSVSYPVLGNQTDALGLDARVQIDLSLPAPARSVVRSEEQTRAYGRQFRAALDAVRKLVPHCGRVHLFYAGPMALAFHLGQQISENIHPPVVVWNFSRAYDWAIDLTAAVSGEPCVVRPAGGTTPTESP
jgi:nucleoside phosphorylase